MTMLANKKIWIIGGTLFCAIVAAVVVVSQLTKTPTQLTMASPTPFATATPKAASINEVVPGNACAVKFTIPCGSGTPTPTPSGSPTPTPSASPTPTPSVSPSPSTPAAANLDCIDKRAYQDDSRNRAGFYFLENRVTDLGSLSDGQTIVYSIAMKNYGGVSVSDVTVTDVLSGNLTYVDADNGCSYEASTRKVTCTVGALAAGVETSRSIRARIGVVGTDKTAIENTAEVFSTNGQRDTCSLRVDASGKVIIPPSPSPVTTTTTTTTLPTAGVFEVTAGTLGAGVLFLILGAVGLLVL